MLCIHYTACALCLLSTCAELSLYRSMHYMTSTATAAVSIIVNRSWCNSSGKLCQRYITRWQF